MTEHLSASAPGARGRLAAVYEEIERDFGVRPRPILLHAPVPELLIASWTVLRETVVADGRLPRAAKELIAMAVSSGNRCRYCVDAHGLMLHALGAGAAERSLFAGHHERIEDPQLAALAAWGAATGSPGAAILARPPFSPAEAPEAIGTALCFHYINRMVTVLLGETPLPVRSRWLRRPLLARIGRRLARRLAAPRRPGSGLAPLPAADVPESLRWAAASPLIAAAFTRFAAAVDAAGAPFLAPPTQARLADRLARWRGEAAPLGAAWIEEVSGGLSPAQAAAARLALLAALAPERARVEVHAFRAHWPGDPPLVSVLAWGSFHAAARISEWLVPAAGRRHPATV